MTTKLVTGRDSVSESITESITVSMPALALDLAPESIPDVGGVDVGTGVEFWSAAGGVDVCTDFRVGGGVDAGIGV